ncbi:MAG: formylglycine-generating enzyme family protein [Fibrobacter sp.]|nr:formylglycine-generating enzyme family protein [Fibrobacter sp.]
MKMKIFLVFIASVAFAANTHLYEVNGAETSGANRTKGPKALFEKTSNPLSRKTAENNIYTAQDSISVPLKDSVAWLEMEKNTDYTICVDGSDKGLWKVKDFSYEKVGDCIQLNSGNYVKNGKIQYVTQIGHVVTFNLLVGMKYIDLTAKKHSLGTETVFEAPYDSKGRRLYRDPIRSEEMNKILAVDKYKVTECEFVQMLWDSIPAQANEMLSDNKNFWIEKKKMMRKGETCYAHDSAAVRVDFYYAMAYANLRSLRDGFKPVYSLVIAEKRFYSFREDGSFGVRNERFSVVDRFSVGSVHVNVDKEADGYRLPYYDEWMALASAYTGRLDDASLKDDSSRTASIAWFGVVDSNDVWTKLDKNKYDDRMSLEHSCCQWRQKSRPVGLLKPNGYGLYDIFGLVCERTMLPGKSIFNGETSICKGGSLTSPREDINKYTRCGDDGVNYKPFQGLRLVREIK